MFARVDKCDSSMVEIRFLVSLDNFLSQDLIVEDILCCPY
jgi:hypothetical protein